METTIMIFGALAAGLALAASLVSSVLRVTSRRYRDPDIYEDENEGVL